MATVLENPNVKTAIAREAAGKAAVAMPLPGPIKQGFPTPDVMVQLGQAVVRVRPCVASDLAMLQKINSPFYQQMIQAAQNKEATVDVSLDFQGMIDAVFLFTRPVTVSRNLLKQGIDAFQDESGKQVGDKWPIENIAAIASAIGQQIEVIFDATVEYGAQAEKNGSQEVFFSDSAPQHKTA